MLAWMGVSLRLYLQVLGDVPIPTDVNATDSWSSETTRNIQLSFEWMRLIKHDDTLCEDPRIRKKKINPKKGNN